MIKNIIALANQKGGVGKTTLNLNIGYELARLGFKVLVIDLDPQASLSKNLLGEDGLSIIKGIEELFLKDTLNPNDFIVKTKIENLFILPCHSELSSVSAKILLDSTSFFAAREILDKVSGFDFCLIDTPPSLGILTLNAFIASQKLIVPISPAFYSMLGVNDLLQSIEKAKKNLNPRLEILGVCLTMMDKRANLYLQIEQEVRIFFGDKVFDTTTSRTVKNEEAIIEGVGVSGIDESCKLAGEYKTLTKEILSRLRGAEIIARNTEA
jgi:chromosome partitioning protein